MATQDEFTKANHVDDPVVTPVQAVYRRLAAVVTNVLGVPLDQIHLDLGPASVGRWDSVGHVVLVTAIEEEFSIHLEEDEIMEFTSFKDILAVVERRIVAPTSDVINDSGGTA
jgi:acyl carrier protein